MSINNKILFFNGDGYPYNFTYNNDIWNGRLFFNPNSTDTFKTLTMYVLEQVEPVTYTGIMNIINDELYNESGMTISPFTYQDISVTNTKTVNASGDFYTKWIEGIGINRMFPPSTVISFSGNISSTDVGYTDFNSDKLFTVLQVKKNAIMIATETNNELFTFLYNSNIDTLKINSHRTISFPEFNNDLKSEYFPGYDMKLSVVGTENNDGVYEIETTGTTYTSIYDYSLDSLIAGDTFTLQLELLTERPLLYNGTVNIFNISGNTYVEFLNNKTANLSVGSNFIIEDINGNHLYNSNEYEIVSFLTEKLLATDDIIITTNEETNTIGKKKKFTKITYNPNIFNLNENDLIYLISTTGETHNNYRKRTIVNITDSLTVGMKDALLNDTLITTLVLSGTTLISESAEYEIYKVLRSYEQNIALVTPSVDNIGGITNNVRCMSTTNIINYTQEIVNQANLNYDNITFESIDVFITRFKNAFSLNGIDIYRKEASLIIEGKYFGQKHYFKTKVFDSTNGEIISNNTFSDVNGYTSIYNFILKDKDLFYERTNMSNELSTKFYADITLNLYDDAQNYGFNIKLNDVDYYIAYNNDSGTTSSTDTTITSFISLWEDVFNKNGLNLSQSIVSGVCHLFIEGQEPNISIMSLLVAVNKNSSYIINDSLHYNKCIMVSSNYLTSDYITFTDYGFTTGMIVSLYGSTYSLNNKEYNIIGLENNKLELSYQGSMYTDENITLSLNSREYLRRPRENNLKNVYYKFRWEDDLNDEMFLYDLSGDNLIPYGNNDNYKYIGVKPLTLNNNEIFLNKELNKDIKHITNPSKQQTIFDELSFELEKMDDDNASILPKPISLYIGYNSTEEGVHQRNLIIERTDDAIITGNADGTNVYIVISGNTITINYGIGFNPSNKYDLLDIGFEVGRILKFKLDDLKEYTQTIFEEWQSYKILNITKNTITLDGTLTTFSTQNENFNFIFEQEPEQIAYLQFYGESESEDERLKANMKMLGITLTEEDEYIFKDSDIKEEGKDYILLNRKRKEMMNVYPEIYNYVGSYKAIFNSIYFFGYEDLQLYEYYQNIDTTSPLYNKLKRVIIPDLLDRNVEGWSYSEDLAKKVGYRKTNLFNLTYKITDEEGNNVNLYSLKEVQTKLNGLKTWLRNNVIPINSNIRDITGVSDSVGTTWRRFDPSVTVIRHKTELTTNSINFNYVLSRNFNDSWIISVRFYTVNDFVPTNFDLKVITYMKDSTGKLFPQQYYTIYKTDMLPYNFFMNWNGQLIDTNMSDRYLYIETSYYNENGMGKKVSKMYNLQDGTTYYYDEFKNYILVNNNFKYKYPLYVQDVQYVYTIDDNDNIYIIEK